jgi:ATP-dependent protease Clp ATPase subunit
MILRFRSLKCSFCKRDESEVAKLVAGPHVYICDRCVAIAKGMMDDAAEPPSKVPVRRSLIRRIIDPGSRMRPPKQSRTIA